MKNKTTNKKESKTEGSLGGNLFDQVKIDKKYFKYTWNVISTVMILFLITIALGIMLSYVKNPFGINAYSVLTDSMTPEISRGSLIFTLESDEYVVGDIITYRPTSGRLGGVEVDTVTHRVSEVINTDGNSFYRTKGDANPGPDVDLAQKEKVVGKVVVGIPLIGFPIEFSKTERGFFILIVIPALFIIYEEIGNIRDEIQKGSSTSKTDKSTRSNIKERSLKLRNSFIKVIAKLQ